MIIKNVHKPYFIIYILLFLPILLTGCSEKNEEKTAPLTYTWEEATVYEAEDGKLLGDALISTEDQGYTGTGYVSGMINEGDGFKVLVNIEEAGFYDINFISNSTSADYKENYVEIDGQSYGTVAVESDVFTDSIIERIYLEAGVHEASLLKYWGWVNVDKILVKKSDELDPDMYTIEKKLVNENASDNAKRLFSYLCDCYGQKIISGQYSTGMMGFEETAIYDETGKYPAILGLDFIEYTPSRVANGSKGKSTDAAINYWQNGGIVTFCWHWNAPEKYLTDEWYSGFYTEKTNINLEKILNGEDEEGYELLMEDIDAIAKQLLILQEEGVPVLWRPLHEASGGWFWWGASGPESYKSLYKLLYKKLTNEYKLNNLIWIWNGQDKEWYPGDEYVDIIGWDIYPGQHVYTSQISTFLEAYSCSTQRKMVVLSENGCLFDPELAFRDGATWGFFCTWSGEFVLENPDYNDYGEKYTERDMLKKVYEDERVITGSDLPDLLNYPIED